MISGTGGFVLDYYNHAMVLSASNTYSGPTSIGSDGNSVEVSLVGNGSISHSSQIFFQGSDPNSTHIDVSGRSDQTLTLASGQTLAGVGAINGSLVVSLGTTISPSGTNSVNGNTSTNAVGAITASGNVILSGTTVLKLNGSGTNDSVGAGGSLTYGGTLNLANISGSPLAVGNSLQVFSASSYNGSFASITPATPGAGLAWDTTQLISGVIKVAVGSSQPVIGSTKVSGGNLILSGTGGMANAGYSVLTTTNLVIPLSNWTLLSTGSFDGSGAFSVTNPISSGIAQSFYTIRTP